MECWRTANSLCWRWTEVLVKPGERAAQDVHPICLLPEGMAFARIDDEFGGHAFGFQRVPEFEGLRGGTFAVAFADNHESWSFHLLDVGDGRTFFVDLRVVIDGGSEVGDHPFVNGVFTVVAEPVGDASACNGGSEAGGLSDGPHGHVAAVAPAGDADAIGVYGGLLQDCIEAAHQCP